MWNAGQECASQSPCSRGEQSTCSPMHVLYWSVIYNVIAIVTQLLSHVQLFSTPWTAACQAPLSSTISQSLLKFMSIEVVMLSNYLVLCRPLLLLPSVFPSIQVFPNKVALCIKWPKHWRFSISTSSEYSGLIPLGLTCLIFLQSRRLSIVFSSTIWRH